MAAAGAGASEEAVGHSAENLRLTRLTLSGNVLGPRGAHGVAEGLRGGGGSGDSSDSPASLVLSLDDNAFGDAGALTIAAALLDASEGGSLEGGPEGTTPGTASSTAPPSRVTSFVHTLDLAGNGLSAKGVLAVIMAGGSCGVSELRLFNNDLGTKGCLELAEVLAGAPHAVVPARRAERAAERAVVSRGGGGDDVGGVGAEGGAGGEGGEGGEVGAGDVVGVDGIDGVDGVTCALRPSPVGATELSLTALDLGGNGMSPDAIAILCVALAGNDSNGSIVSAASAESADSGVCEGVGGALGDGGGDVGGNAAAAAATKPLPRLRSLGLGGNDMDATAEELVLGLSVSRPDLDIARDKHKVRGGVRRRKRERCVVRKNYVWERSEKLCLSFLY